MVIFATSSNDKDEAEDSMLLFVLDREETGGTGDLLRAGGVGGEKDDKAWALTSDVVLLWGDS
jgi:hypothetical protein